MLGILNNHIFEFVLSFNEILKKRVCNVLSKNAIVDNFTMLIKDTH